MLHLVTFSTILIITCEEEKEEEEEDTFYKRKKIKSWILYDSIPMGQ